MKDSDNCFRMAARSARVGCLLSVAWICLFGCSPSPEAPSADSKVAAASSSPGATETYEEPEVGGRLVVALTSEPRTFNPATGVSQATLILLSLTHRGLMALDPMSQEIRPSLAVSWTAVPTDGEDFPLYRIDLPRDLKFSDGEPFDADDVLFTIEAILDERVGSPQLQTLMVDDEPISVTAIDSHTVQVRLPSPVADPGMLFESLYILPEHLLRDDFERGELASAWGTETSPSELAGLGPFRLASYRPGERIVLERNPHYFQRDDQDRALPYLDEIVVLLLTDMQSSLLRFEAGEVDVLSNVPVDGFQRLQVVAEERGLQMRDLGAGAAYEFLFFNLNDLGTESRSELIAKQSWFRSLGFRKAISHAVDRQGIVDLVYNGKATSLGTHVSPGKSRWFVDIEPPETSLTQAKEHLARAGFRWSEKGRLLDSGGAEVKLSIATNSSNPRRVQTATLIQEDLSKLGMEVQVVSLEFGALLDRVTNSFDYEIALLGLGRGGVDPSSDLNVWHSSGSNHLWHLGVDCPTTEWERRIDELMELQKSELDFAKRKELYGEVQRLVFENQPVVTLVAPNVLVGANKRIGNFSPTIFEPTILWNVERLYRRSDRP